MHERVLELGQSGHGRLFQGVGLQFQKQMLSQCSLIEDLTKRILNVLNVTHAERKLVHGKMLPPYEIMGLCASLTSQLVHALARGLRSRPIQSLALAAGGDIE